MTALDLLCCYDVALRCQSILVEMAVSINHVASHDILSIERDELAGQRWERHVEVDLQLLLRSALIDKHLALPGPSNEHRKLGEKQIYCEGHGAARDSSSRKRRFRQVS